MSDSDSASDSSSCSYYSYYSRSMSRWGDDDVDFGEDDSLAQPGQQGGVQSEIVAPPLAACQQQQEQQQEQQQQQPPAEIQQQPAQLQSAPCPQTEAADVQGDTNIASAGTSFTLTVQGCTAEVQRILKDELGVLLPAMDSYENRMEICGFIIGKARHALAAARARFQTDLNLSCEGLLSHQSALWHSMGRSRAYRTELAKSMAEKLSKQGVGNALVLEDCVQDFIGALFDATSSVDTAWEPLIAFVSKRRKRVARDVLLKAVGLLVDTTPGGDAERATSVTPPASSSVDGMCVTASAAPAATATTATTTAAPTAPPPPPPAPEPCRRSDTGMAAALPVMSAGSVGSVRIPPPPPPVATSTAMTAPLTVE
eukprot:4707989-Amphidinium_carterae.2